MATLQQIADALKRADAAGDTEGAKKLAMAYKTMAAQTPASTVAVPPAGLTPGSREYADWAAKAAMSGQTLPTTNYGTHYKAGETPPDTSFPTQVMAGTTAAANAIPIAGPAVLHGLESVRGAIQHMTPEQVAAETKLNEANNPTAATIGSVTGRVLPYVAAAEVPGLATVLGLSSSAPIGASIALGGLSQMGIDYADNKMRGQDPNQTVIDAGPIHLTSGELAAAGGALGPLVGPVVGATARGLGSAGEKIGDAFQSVFHPNAAADKSVGTVIAGDLAAGQHMTGADLAAAQQTQQPLINADVFGGQTKGLLQKALPADPALMQATQSMAAERAAIGAKKDRAVQFFNDVTGGNTNFQTAQDLINAGKNATNNAAYEGAAYIHPNATNLYTPKLQAMVTAAAADPDSALRQAINMTKTAGANQAVAAAAKGVPVRFPIKNPFRFAKDGSVSLVNNAQPDLPFWDQVQRNLGTLASQAKGGDSLNIADTQRALNAELDNVVPPFQTARQGVAAQFGANNALEAGQKFALSNIDPNVAAAGVAKFSPQEQKLFGVGMLSKVVNTIQQAGSAATVDKLLDPAGKAMQQLKIGLSGWPKYVQDQVPAFMRVQQTLNDTAKYIKAASANNLPQQLGAQLGQAGLQSGVGGIAGAVVSGGTGGSINPLDWNLAKMGSGAAIGAAMGAGLKLGIANVNRNVLSRVAAMLASNDPTAMKGAIAYATKNPQASQALRVISHGASALAQQATVSAGLLASPTATAAPPQQPQAQGTAP